RGCGDKISANSLTVPLDGSPPRMRGQVLMGCSSAILIGLTPADAGTRCNIPAISHKIKDHPRGCGDKSWTL
ncbi:hypothetical protein, partial [Faecalibaculum rodentium]|uniref:hypothetical protein n=1 Tax=Faecalibaculum rodentium TaxID=1702221 RepID=UPI003EB840FD